MGIAMQQKLEEHGVSQMVSTAADKTLEVSSKLYHTSAEKLQELQQNPTVSELTEKSKNTLGVIGGSIAEASTVSTYLW